MHNQMGPQDAMGHMMKSLEKYEMNPAYHNQGFMDPIA